jgi:hypothetical protein
MEFILRTLKKGFFWSYARTSWQWDVLCVLILVFIFLTPKSWFDNRGQQLPQEVIVLSADVVGAQPDTREIERRIRLMSGRAEAQVTEVRPRRDSQGNVIGYEVDIR